MKEKTYYFYRHIGEHATGSDPRIMVRLCTQSEAQETCDELNKSGKAYYYYMDIDQVEKEKGSAACLPASTYTL